MPGAQIRDAPQRASARARASRDVPNPSIATALNPYIGYDEATVVAKESAKRGVSVRDIVRETAGFAPYEKRVQELIKMGSASSLKRSLKFAKKRLGSHKRAKAKKEEMTQALAAQRKK